MFLVTLTDRNFDFTQDFLYETICPPSRQTPKFTEHYSNVGFLTLNEVFVGCPLDIYWIYTKTKGFVV